VATFQRRDIRPSGWSAILCEQHVDTAFAGHANNSKIEWTELTRNPVTGCTNVSPGCETAMREFSQSVSKRWALDMRKASMFRYDGPQGPKDALAVKIDAVLADGAAPAAVPTGSTIFVVHGRDIESRDQLELVLRPWD
jgi:Protein of unknown function (DUF5131)